MKTPEEISSLPGVLPTIKEGSNNHEKIISDHAPVLMTIPLPKSEKTIKVLSWNVLGIDIANGFSSSDSISNGLPKYEEKKE